MLSTSAILNYRLHENNNFIKVIGISSIVKQDHTCIAA